MNILLHSIFICLLFIVFYQDLKERKVTLLVFILSVFIGGYIHVTHVVLEAFLASVSINFLTLVFIGFILFLYAKFILKKKLFTTIGIGDFLFFILLACSFPTATFLVLFSTSLIFSLVLFLLLKPQLKHKTVPLAGFQAVFLSLVLLLNCLFNFVDLYAI